MNGYPPSHRRTNEPQPEVCDLCGTTVGGARLRTSHVHGLRGFRVCDVTPGCRRFRSALSYRDRIQQNPRPVPTIGDSRVYEPGAPAWWENPVESPHADGVSDYTDPLLLVDEDDELLIDADDFLILKG